MENELETIVFQRRGYVARREFIGKHELDGAELSLGRRFEALEEWLLGEQHR